jgi:hypothetical protein
MSYNKHKSNLKTYPKGETRLWLLIDMVGSWEELIEPKKKSKNC